MKLRRRSGLALGIIVMCMAPLIDAMEGGPVDEPWPSLLASGPDSVDPVVAMLQLRANLTLDRLVQSGRASPQRL
jgi:hypothetical protein